MLIRSLQPPFGTYSSPFGAGEVPKKVDAAISLLSEMKSEVIDPTVRKSRHQFISSVSALRTELKKVCGVDPQAQDIGTFLQVLDCWLTEAFGWWTQIATTGYQTEQTGNQLLAASVQRSGSLATVMQRAGNDMVDTGRRLKLQGESWKQAIRAIDKLSPVIRDAVILYNDALDSGQLNAADPRVAELQRSFRDIINDWKFEIVLRAVDTGFAMRKLAVQQASINAQVIGAISSIAAMTPQLLDLVQRTLDTLDSLLRSIDLFSMPSQAVDGMGRLLKKAVQGGLEAGTKPIGDLLLKIGLVVGSVAVAAVTGLIILRKTGVIGEISTPKLSGPSGRRKRRRH